MMKFMKMGCLMAGASVAAFAHAATCDIHTLTNEGKYAFVYRPIYFDLSKNYELGKPLPIQSDEPLVYRKIGKRDSVYVTDVDVSYASDWFLAIKFRLKAGRRYLAVENAAGVGDLNVIEQSGGSGNTQLL